ncbi:helix-turn-helix domain-containing protein [Geomicrobium sediminis]|uniref:Transcriptional regulator with XRE-family HTH domain n=1 Tax=Geomicrobium sediminis TaxID=1347788 RepID=A0ABS2P6V0_9BACL|nr:transcriptional regulator with XRE-family HTH domain [Geomicrobium sediminis]
MQHLKEIRKRQGLSQEGMAMQIGVSISYYEKVEGGFKNPSFQFLVKLKKSFGEKVDLNKFF